MAKLTYIEIMGELRETSKVSLDTKGSYSYVCGLYESLLGDIAADLPVARQEEIVRALRLAQVRMKESS